MQSAQVSSFLAGMLEGAEVAGLSETIARRIGEQILPAEQESDWRDLLQRVDPSATRYLGHQFACVLSCLKPKDRETALANIYRLMEQCQKLVGGTTVCRN